MERFKAKAKAGQAKAKAKMKRGQREAPDADGDDGIGNNKARRVWTRPSLSKRSYSSGKLRVLNIRLISQGFV